MSVLRSLSDKGNILFDIRPGILLQVSHRIVPIFTELCNRCFEAGIYPSVFKIARVVPIFKSGDLNNINNYRPISTLLTLNKIFESVVLNRLKFFVKLHNLISLNQFGFHEGLGTTHAIFTLMRDFISTYKKRLYTIVLFLDLGKAFDTVNIQILIHKLNSYGFKGLCGDLIKSYLTDGQQYVNITDYNSDKSFLVHSVPQGSVLGHFLFTLFVNDISNIERTKIILFADDAALYVTDNCMEVCVEKINGVISRLSNWLNLNRLIPNVRKRS